ncbi:AAA family ATPase [Helicobacter sp. 11S03491-1]|uniref:AAA family ATPase n=1 Tax=Helicobacter sp. 11S03491-1 TaxID=1476196 RepID=UPI000BA7C4F0|nr:AAA family ATPase [Helicobacter sp. 11S03491-1]PAF41048.1 hypothetical protein BKH45_08550 [Helicobacter sp. 11S03491-1]
MRHLIVITGTNGVGKSTFGENLKNQLKMPFINLDIFYKEKFGSYRQYTQEEIIEASKELSMLRESYFRNNQSFILERIIQTPDSINGLLEKAKDYGFETSLFYIGTSNSLETSETRINDRVSKGFHFVDKETVKNNLLDVTKSFKVIANKFDNVVIYDNSRNYENAKRLLDIRHKQVYLARELPDFAKEIIENTFIEEKLKSYYEGKTLENLKDKSFCIDSDPQEQSVYADKSIKNKKRKIKRP